MSEKTAIEIVGKGIWLVGLALMIYGIATFFYAHALWSIWVGIGFLTMMVSNVWEKVALLELRHDELIKALNDALD